MCTQVVRPRREGGTGTKAGRAGTYTHRSLARGFWLSCTDSRAHLGKTPLPRGLQPSTATKESLLYATELECQCPQSEQLRRAKYMRWPICLRPQGREDQSLLTPVSVTQPSPPTFQPRSEGPVFLTACTQTPSRATFCRSNLGRSGMGLGPTVPTSGGSRLGFESNHRGH